MTQKNNMLKISSTMEGQPTFKLIPLDLSSPFNEVIFHPVYKLLAILSKEKYSSFNYIPKLNDNGDYEMIKGTSKRKQQRVLIESCHEYKITERSEIENFVNMFAINGPHNLEEYFKVAPLPEMSQKAPVDEALNLEIVKG